jgi:YfiH family protein
MDAISGVNAGSTAAAEGGACMIGLVRQQAGDIAVHVDPWLREHHGILVAFSERSGGRSLPPFASLNLAGHVGDDPLRVDDNRALLLAALGIEPVRAHLTVPEQVHGSVVRQAAGAIVGMGAFARAGAPPPVPAADALLTLEPDTPLMLCFADCVPVVLVALGPKRAVAVVHAGWRGALSRIADEAACRLAAAAGCPPEELLAYIGPHIGGCHYEVGDEVLSQFTDAFGSIAAAQGRLDLGAVVSQSLNGVGVPFSSQVRSTLCTAERTDAFYSHRAEGPTGRHGALACILGSSR